MNVYAIFYLREGEAPQLCSLHCTLKQAQSAALSHSRVDDVSCGVLKMPLLGFPWGWITIGALIVFAVGLAKLNGLL